MVQSSSEPAHARPRRSQHRGIWAVIAVLLLAVLVATLWVPIYNKTTPVWGGWPFFYWFQMAFVGITVAIVTLVYQATRKKRRS